MSSHIHPFKEKKMKMTQKSLTLIALIALSVSPFAKAERKRVSVDGSSTVFPIMEASAEEFQNNSKGKVLVTVGISGTGGGFKKFCRGEIDIQNASLSIKQKEITKCSEAGINYIEIPIAYDAITLVVSKDNTWLKEITLAELKKIWEPSAQEKIKTWNQVRADWPEKPIRLYGAGSDSGTFDYFTEVVTGTSRASRSDYSASEDDNTLVQGVSQDTFALGYIPYSYYDNNKNKLKALAVKADAKSIGVVPSLDNIATGAYQPFARPIFLYVSINSLKKKEVEDFLGFTLGNATKLVTDVQSIPLSPKAYATAIEKVKARQPSIPGTKEAKL